MSKIFTAIILAIAVFAGLLAKGVYAQSNTATPTNSPTPTVTGTDNADNSVPSGAPRTGFGTL